MRLNSEDSRALGGLVKKVNVDGEVLQGTTGKTNLSELMVNDILYGDFKLAVDPAVLGSSLAVITADIADEEKEKFTRTVVCKLVNKENEVREYFNGKIPVSVAKSSTAGIVSIGAVTELEFVNGQATVDIEYTGTWEVADTCTLTLGTNFVVAGITLDAVTSVDTLV